MAGPERPPKPVAMEGFRVLALTLKARKVFTRVSASAPADNAASATASGLGALGESLTHRGRWVRGRKPLTSEAKSLGSCPNSMPPLFTLGQETLSSYAAIPSSFSSRSMTVAYSSSVSPKTFTTTHAPRWRRVGSTSVQKASTPMFCRPMELIMPAGVSTMRGFGLPILGLGERPLVTTAPSASGGQKSTRSKP
ncbi:hypothetical protein HRbin09_01377 [bacterium HR09]|nr:hypothetical protein HRbin09_01377 [bacterium HR09]